MKSSTHTLTVRASKDRTFDFLSRIENLPKWATLFCKELKPMAGGRYKVITPQGEIFFRIDGDFRLASSICVVDRTKRSLLTGRPASFRWEKMRACSSSPPCNIPASPTAIFCCAMPRLGGGVFRTSRAHVEARH